MKKILFIGKTGSGKTSLIQRLRKEPLVYQKTQAMIFDYHFLDSPGEYLESKRMLNALIVSSADCSHIGLVQQADDYASLFPPGLSMVFNKPIIGVVTKIDLIHKDIPVVITQLERAGAEKIFCCSATTDEGIPQLSRYLQKASF